MPRVKCPACEKPVFKQAPTCPWCGHPFKGSDDEPDPRFTRRGGGWWKVLLGITVAVLLVACVLGKIAQTLMKVTAPVDSRIVVGSWTVSATTADGTISGSETFSGNGTYTLKITIRTNNGVVVDHGESGTWRVENGHLSLTTTQSSRPELSAVGETDTEDIVKLTEDEMITRDGQNNTYTYRRVTTK
jgi:hypothetical protein